MSRSIKLAVAATGLALFWAGSVEAAQVFPAAKDYGAQGVGTSSAPATFQLSTSPTVCIATSGPPDHMCIAWTSYSVSTTELGGPPGTTTAGDFVLHNVDCPYPALSSPPTIAGLPGSCSFEASFAPTAGGPRSRTLRFPETPQGSDASLSLTGTGITPAVPVAATPPAAFNLKAAIRKCRKKFPKGPKRKKCIKRARQKAAALG